MPHPLYNHLRDNTRQLFWRHRRLLLTPLNHGPKYSPTDDADDRFQWFIPSSLSVPCRFEPCQEQLGQFLMNCPFNHWSKNERWLVLVMILLLEDIQDSLNEQ